MRLPSAPAGLLQRLLLALALAAPALPCAAADLPAAYDLHVIEDSLSGSGLSKRWAAVELGYDGHRCGRGGCSLIPALPNQAGALGISTSAMNGRGWVVGSSYTLQPGVQHAVRFDGERVLDLGALPADACGGCSLTSFAAAINRRGDAVGYSQDGQGNDMAVLWRRGGAIQPLGSLGGAGSIAQGINDHGVVVGRARRADGALAAFMWRDGVMHELPSPDGRLPAIAQHVDNAGRVVISTNDGAHSQAFLWHAGQATPIAPRADATDVIAEGMDGRGNVVGWWILRHGRNTTARGFITNGQATHDLNDHLVPWAARAYLILSADAINERGQILAWAHRKATFENVMVVLTPREPGQAPPR